MQDEKILIELARLILPSGFVENLDQRKILRDVRVFWADTSVCPYDINLCRWNCKICGRVVP